MKSSVVLAVCGLALAAPFTAAAQRAAGEVCLTADGQVEPTATRGWQEALANSDPRGIQFMSGTWYNRTDSPSTNQVSHTYATFEPTGGLVFRNIVCNSNDTGCMNYDGYGAYAVQMNGDQIALFRNVSDDHHSSFCTLASFTAMDQNTLRATDGAVLQRMQ